MAKAKHYVFTKAELKRLKAKDAKMTPAERLAVSKSLVEANTAANTPRKKRKV